MVSDSEHADDALDAEEDIDDYDQDAEEDTDVAPDDGTEDGDDDLQDTEVDEDSEMEGSEADDGDGDDSSVAGEPMLEDNEEVEPSATASDISPLPAPPPSAAPLQPPPPPKQPSPPAQISRKRSRSPSPAYTRRKLLVPSPSRPGPRTYTVEAICAMPHPVPTHALASSTCLTHLITGSDDGYIRDYDIFAAVNSNKTFLTAPQRHHAGVVEGIMKAGQLRFWWECQAPRMHPPPQDLNGLGFVEEEIPLLPIYSLAMHSDALWTLAGTDIGLINLFTTRHEPGRLIHTMAGHRGRPVSALALEHDEKGFYSAGWDGDATLWDLNNGQVVRQFTSHGAQLTSVAVRPMYTGPVESGLSQASSTTLVDTQSQPARETDAKSDASFDPLFDDEPEPEMALPTKTAQFKAPPARATAPPKNAPPLLDTSISGSFSADIILTSSIDGQVMIWDKRAAGSVGRLWMSEKTPPWCVSACWSADGSQVYAGRRNGTVDVWDTRQLGRSGAASVPRLVKTIRNPASSGVVSCVVAFPDGKHIATASIDNLRLWNVAEAGEPVEGKTRGGVQFKIIPGHHGGYISQMLVDPAARFLVSASSNRGWHGDSTKTVFVHDIKHIA